MANYGAMPLAYSNTPVPAQQQPTWGQRFRGLLNNQDLAMALLANSGYSPQKRSFGEVLGTSMLQANQMQQQRQDDAFKRQYMQAQMAAMQKQSGMSNKVEEFEYAQKNPEFKEWLIAQGQTSRPSPVQEWEVFSKMSPDEQRRYLEMKRNPNWKVGEVAGAPTVIAGLPGGAVQTTPLSTAQQEIAVAAERKAAESQAGAIGTGAGQVIADIQKKGANAKTVTAVLDIADPLIDAATGSLVGAGADKVAAAFGKALSGAEATAQLQVLQAGLMLNQPRMEGPQSDADVLLYRQAAGQLGDPTVPREIKKAAIKTIRMLQQKYMDRAAQGGAPAALDDETAALVRKYGGG